MRTFRVIATPGLAARLVGALVLVAACAAPSASSTPPPAPPTVPATAPPTPLLTASPTPTVVLAPTATPIPPTATPVPPLAMQISAQLDPPTPHAGEAFVLALSVTNNGDRTAHGVYIATSGPWDQWTVLGVEPSGTFGSDPDGWHIITDEEVPAGETRTILVHIRADQASQEQLTFAVREAEPAELAVSS